MASTETLSYESAVASLYELGHELARTPSPKFDLAHMRVLLGALEHPERRIRAVLVAGTNGKGSTAATLASILELAGHRTGLYTSPHLVRINERIRLDGQDIPDADFSAAYARVEEAARALLSAGALPWHPSFFEVLTAMTLDYFARQRVDIAVLEVGMGGRLDATNVVDPLLSVITDISLDHQKFLGNTIRQIATEKAGIIHPGGLVVTLPQHPEANDVIGQAVLEQNARAVSAATYVPPLSPGAGPADPEPFSGNWKLETGNSYPLTVMGEEILIESPLAGRHQLRNVALAVAAAVELSQMGVAVRPAAIAGGVRRTRWPGRFQVRQEAGPNGAQELVMDVAHNPAGAWALRSTLSERYEGRPLILVFGVLRDKAVTEIAQILFPLAERVIATRAENPRSASPEEICEAAASTGTDVECREDVAGALERARQLASPGAVIVITGSIYVVGEALRLLQG